MNLKTNTTLRTTLAFLAMLCLPVSGGARVHGKENIDRDHIKQGDIHVAKDETTNGDIVTSGAITIDGAVNGDCVALGGPVTVNGEVLGDIVTVGGPAKIFGSVKGDVAALGGPVQVDGQVKGEVASLGGDVALGERAAVGGDIALLGGKLTRAEGASVMGSVANFDLSMVKHFLPLMSRFKNASSAPKAPEEHSTFSRLLRYAAFVAFLAGLGLTMTLLSVFVPSQIETVAAAVKEDFWKSAAIGALIFMLIIPGLVLMAVSVLGIPLIPLALILVCASTLMSLASFSLILSERFFSSLNKPVPSTVAAVGLGYLLLTSLLMIGKLLRIAGGIGGLMGGIFVLANLILISCGLLVGFGAIWSTRLGSRRGPLAA